MFRSIDTLEESEDKSQKTGFLECKKPTEDKVAEYKVNFHAENMFKFSHCDYFDTSKLTTRCSDILFLIFTININLMIFSINYWLSDEPSSIIVNLGCDMEVWNPE